MADWPYNTAQWKRLRLRHLSMHPLCEGCEAAGRGPVIANTVDHRVSISEGGNPFPAHDGLASYCPSCHGQKTARGAEAGAVRSTRVLQPRKGCDADGNPLDQSHPWGDAARHGHSQRANLSRGVRGALGGGHLLDDDATPQPEVERGKSLRAASLKTAVPLRNQLVSKDHR